MQTPLKPITKSAKLANVCYDIRGPVMEAARQMEEEGHKIIKLNIGNVAAFGLMPPDEIVDQVMVGPGADVAFGEFEGEEDGPLSYVVGQ